MRRPAFDVSGETEDCRQRRTDLPLVDGRHPTIDGHGAKVVRLGHVP
jgi:hypothetical protein